MAVSFLKKGKAAHEQVASADKETEKKKAAGMVRRFWIPQEAETQITFLDGALDDDGLLETVTYWEHQLRLNGDWRNWYACTQDQEPCPICQGSSDTPSLVAAFTVIDHTKWVSKQDNVEHQHEPRLFICKRETFKRLQKIATKRGGLTGITFDVSRTGDKSPSVGSDFDFVEKRTLSVIKKAYDLKAADAKAYDYEKVIMYRDAEELKKLGFGLISVGGADAAASAKPANYDQDL
jgi:hypothetical protein